MEQVQDLVNNEWIEKCGGPWGSSIFLAAIPHYGYIKNIDNIIWRMFVSYKIFNGITKPFDFLDPISMMI